MRVRIHWNLQRKLWSVSHRTPRGWRVLRDDDGKQVLYTKVILRDVEFKVSAAGQRRCRLEGVRNVHAYADGELLHWSVNERTATVPCGVRVGYNPYHLDTFCTLHDGGPITGSEMAVFAVDSGVLVPDWGIRREAA